MKTKTLFKIKLKILIVILITLITITGCNKYSKEIEKSCSDCEQIKVRKSEDLIFVKKSNGEGNVFSKSQMKFLLDSWYPSNYDEGIIYDDITFTVAGNKISFTESEYTKISNENLKKKSSYTCSYCKNTYEGKPYRNDYLLGEDKYWCTEKCFSDDGYSIRDSGSSVPEGYHRGGSCNACGGSGKTQHDIVGTRGDDTGSQCASCAGRGFNLVKD